MEQPFDKKVKKQRSIWSTKQDAHFIWSIEYYRLFAACIEEWHNCLSWKSRVSFGSMMCIWYVQCVYRQYGRRQPSSTKHCWWTCWSLSTFEETNTIFKVLGLLILSLPLQVHSNMNIYQIYKLLAKIVNL